MNPYFAEVWFAPLNGLFLYTPLAVFIVGGLVYMVIKRIPNGILLLSLFILVSYLFASWQTWYFGCSFGQRSFVEYYAVFAVPLGILIRDAFYRTGLLVWPLLIVFLLLVIQVNQRMARSFERCFFGSVWDFGQYKRHLATANLGLRHTVPQTFTNDFENHALYADNLISHDAAFSGKNSATFDHKHMKVGMVVKFVWEFWGDPPQRIRVSFQGLKKDPARTCTTVECVVSYQEDIIYSREIAIDDQITGLNTWNRVQATFRLPELRLWETMMMVYIRSDSPQPIYLDDLKVTFE
jgi:hypothetical protein